MPVYNLEIHCLLEAQTWRQFNLKLSSKSQFVFVAAKTKEERDYRVEIAETRHLTQLDSWHSSLKVNTMTFN